MTDQIISQVLDFGALGSFAAFLVWQHVNMQKKFEKLVVSFQTQLKEIDTGYERRIEIMRERYDKVISDIRQECRNKEDALLSQVQSLQGQLLARERESLFRLKDK
tara:strand:- start:444 stop:761 length:318 start_codon:yes stop_codon:yes gene_type:complete